MTEYSQGILGDGAAILKDGQPLTVDEIVASLCDLTEQRDTPLNLLERAESALCKYQHGEEALLTGSQMNAVKMRMENNYSPLVLEIKATITAIKEKLND